MAIEEPNLAGNVFFLACHALLLAPQLFLGIRHKTWGFLFGMCCGHILEAVGYAGRVRMHYGEDGFLTYIVCITIGPAFFSAAIYLCLARIIAVYGEHLSYFKPRTYTITFMVADALALALQATGGGILGQNDLRDQKRMDLGLAIIQTGLGAHLAAIGIFVILALTFGIRVFRNQDKWGDKFADLQTSRRFITFLIGLSIATLCILIRTAFRVAELSEGFNSDLANNEVAFTILESAMVLIAAICLTVFHPGLGFSGRWSEANFTMRSKKGGRGSRRAKGDAVELRSV